MSHSRSEYNLRSRLYKDMNSPMQSGQKLGGRFGSGILVPRVSRKKKKMSKSQKLPPITFDNGTMHMSFIGRDQSMITKKQSVLNSGMSVFGSSNFFGVDSTIGVEQNRSKIREKMLDPVMDEEDLMIQETEEDEEEKPKNYLTPLDFAQLVRDDPEMRDEFCYLKKRDNPYDWEIVQFDKIENKEKGIGAKKKKDKITLKEVFNKRRI